MQVMTNAMACVFVLFSVYRANFMVFERFMQGANRLAAQLVERMGIAYNNPDKVG